MPPAADPATLLPEVLHHPALRDESAGWSRAALAGRITELVGGPAAPALTLATSLVLDAQREGETTAWVMRDSSTFFPPDMAAWGVDLDALVVVRVPRRRSAMARHGEAQQVARAADRLARSGAFGLIALDLGPTPTLPTPLMSRLLGLAIKHDIALLCLTESRTYRLPGEADRRRAGLHSGSSLQQGGLGSLVSLRVEAERRRLGEGRFAAELHAVKDKRRAPGWNHVEVCGGPPGLC